MSGSLSLTNGLSMNDAVTVTISLAPTAIPLRNFGAFLILGPTPKVIDTNERLRVYTTLTGVVNDFGSSAPEYLAANLFFSQNPQPSILYVGRWAQAPTAAGIHGGTVSVANQLMSGWTAITTGSMVITVDGTVKTLSALNFASQTNLNGVAGVIQTALGGSITCVWNSNYSRFEIYSGTTGASSTITYASPTGSGVDISAKAGLTAASGASAPCNGIVAETPLVAMTTLANYGVWYGGMFAPAAVGDITDAQYIAAATFIAGASPSRIMAITSQSAAILDPTQTGDIASQLKALTNNRAFVQYSSSSLYAAAAAFGRGFTVDFSGNNTTITLKFKTEPGVVAETLNETQAATAIAKNANVFVNYSNGAAIIQNGVMSGGAFFDVIHGTDWLQNLTQTDVFNLLYTTTTKVPQTNPGMHLIATTIENSMIAGVYNGLLAPGQWNAPGFGQLSQGQYLTKGYYVFCQPIEDQNQSDRAARKATLMQVAAKLAGAVHTANVIINVNN